ncbi:sulfurtransferase [Stratiformator vulcanicus]|uniref:tRNA uridine(34) hydroxylase n=1 Tax=Stratiformator vulcanicus TaxID=2527980 RepID=A0A517R271_9PLAN|nr:sulfurtransferase [Stratiformator vulcanicus]QDT37985.1 Ribosomal large subunit pseudouridine synthase C [Stratiformator vulcanicus]
MMSSSESTQPPEGLPIANIAAYKFVSITGLAERRSMLRERCKDLGLKGTILLSPEGINLFLAGRRSPVSEFVNEIQIDAEIGELDVKWSYSESQPFSRTLVKVKQEIIAFGVDGIAPGRSTSPKLPAKELKQWLDEGRPITLLDTRNDYEVRLGTFEGAVPIGVDHFRDFPAAVEELPEEMKDQPVVMFCTGGIRCEKAGPMMEQAGFRSIFQLEGGILKYFEECGDAHYDGDCFVFDQRVAVDPDLRETDTKQCFSCQAPLTLEEQQSELYEPPVSCPHCHESSQEKMQRLLRYREEQMKVIASPLPGSKPYELRRPMQIAAKHAGRALRDVLIEMFPGVSTKEWDDRFRLGRIVFGNETVLPDRIVTAGERYENVKPEAVEPNVNADIRFLYEDDAIVVVDKPAPLPMHPCGRFQRNSLTYLLNELYAPQVVRIVHRLDANTTGVVVLARTRDVARKLQPQFARGEVEKTYIAHVHGHPPSDEFTCDAPIGSGSVEAGAREIDESGLASLTRFQVRDRFSDGTALVEAMPETGRTNQIRLHLWHLGHPIIGDPTYQQDGVRENRQTLSVDEPPMRLHAVELRLRHPTTGTPIRFESALSKSMGSNTSL